MFTPRKGKVAINPGGSPEFQVQYIGSTVTYKANGLGCTTPNVQKLWDNSPEERYLRRISLTLSSSGIVMKDLENHGKTPDVKFDIHDISYCCAEKDIHERVFSWIWKNDSEKRLECHAVLCSSKEKAQTLSLVLSRAFQIAYRDWKNEKEKKERMRLSSKQLLKNRILPNEGTARSNTPQIKINQQQNGNTFGSSNGVENQTSNGTKTPNPNDFSEKHINIDTDNLEHSRERKTSQSREFDLEHEEMLRTLKSIKTTSGEEISTEDKLDTVMSQMNIVEEDVLSFTDNNLVNEIDGVKL